MSSKDESPDAPHESEVELPLWEQSPFPILDAEVRSLDSAEGFVEHDPLSSTDDGVNAATNETASDEFPTFINSSLLADRPGYQLYSPGCVAWAAFWGGFLGGAIVLARNYWVLKRRGEGVVVFLALTALLVTALYSLSDQSAWLFSFLTWLVAWFCAWFLQGHLYRKHEKAGGPRGSGIGAFGFGLLGCVLTVFLAVGIEVMDQASLGTRLVIGWNDEVYYSGGVTAEEAQRLGDFLKADGSFDETQHQTVVLSKDGPTFLISYFFDAGEWNDPKVVKDFEEYATTLSAEVFLGQPVQVLLCQGMDRVERRLDPKTGVSSKLWERHFEAGSKANDEGRYSDGEAAYRAAVQEAERHESLRKQLIWSLNNVANTRLNQDLTDDVEPHFQRVLSLAELAFGKDSYEASYALNGLARWEWERSHLPEAETFFRRALAMREKVQDEREPDQTEIRESLIKLLIARESFAAAVELQQQQVTLVEKLPKTDPAEQASRLRLLGWLSWRTGKYQESKKHFENALVAFERTSDAASEEYLLCLWHMGLLSHALGEYETAGGSFRRAIKILDNAKDSDGLRRADFQEALANLLTDQAKYDESEQLHRQVLEQREKSLDKDHVEIGESLGRLGALALQLGRYPEAEVQLRRAIDIFEKSETHARRRLADCLHDFALLRHTQGRYADAEPLYRKALAVREEILGAEHDQVATTISALSELYSDRGDYAAAEPLARRAHDMAEKRLGAEHPFLLRTRHRLALVQIGQRKLDEAEQTLRRALEIGGKTLGSQHPYLAESQNTLAAVLLDQERPSDAEPLLEQALRSFEAVLGPVHPQLVGPLNNLGSIYEHKGRDAAAAEHFERALKLAEELVGKEHPYLLPILANSAKVLRKLNRPNEAQDFERRAAEIRAKHKLDTPQPGNSLVT